MEYQKQDEFYEKFRKRLDETTEFPSKYIYKFIIPTSHKGIAEISKVFDGAHPQFQLKESKNGKYTSVTVITFVIDAEQVIYYYQRASVIPGIIML